MSEGEGGKRGRGRPKKAQWADLPQEFQDSVATMQEPELRNLVAKVAMQEEENKKNCREDEHLKECRNTAAEAGKQYKDNTKANILKIRFLKQVLEDKGKATT